MRSVFVWFFVLIVASGFCLAADDWEDISVEGPAVVDNQSVNNVVEEEIVYSDVVDDQVVTSGDGKFYTQDFYIFLGLLGVVLIIILVFIWLWIRGAKNQWD